MTASVSPILKMLQLAKAPSRRAELVSMLVDVYAANSARFSADVKAEFDVILTTLIDSVSQEDRRAAAERLAPLTNAPPRLMRLFAEDAFEVAAPVLLHSRAIDAPTLHRIARDSEDGRLAFIAQRPDCSASLSDILADRGDEATLVALAQNQRAVLDGSALDVMTVRARKYASMHEPMTARFDLPPLVLTRLYFLVAPHLRKEIMRRADIIDPALAASAATANRKSVLTENGDRLDNARTYMRKTLRGGGVTQSLLCDLLRSGPSPVFLVAFAHYAGVEIDAARIMLADRRREALALACRATETPRPIFAKLLFGLTKLEEEEAQAARILDLYMKIPREAAERLMRFWRVRGRAAAPAAQTPPLRAAG